MADENTIVRERQRAIRREMDRRGISIKAVQFDGGWDTPSTVLSYFPADPAKEPAIMSAAALYRLHKALPLDLLSLMLPDGHAIVKLPEGIDHDQLAELMHDYLHTKTEAHHPNSPAARDISPCEDAKLRTKAVRLVGSAAA